MEFKKSSLSILISAIITGSIAPYSFAQDASEVKKEQTTQVAKQLTSAEQAREDKAKEESESIERIIVNGYEASLDAAEENKRSADQFLDAISAAGLGEFADDSVGDALNNMTGVNIDSNDGIADGIYIDGLPPEYTQIQINGNTMGAGTNDSASFVTENATTTGIFSTAVLSGLEVFKSARADKSEGSLGGSVNFKTWKPLNFKKPKFNISMTAGFQEMNGDVDGKASFLYGGRTDDEKYGWVITASHDVTKGRIDTFSVSDQVLRLYDLDGDADETRETAFVTNFNYRVKERETTRTNLVTAFQYQATENLTLSIEGNYAKFSRWFHEEKNQLAFGANKKYFVDDDVFSYEAITSPNEDVTRLMNAGVAFSGTQSLVNFERETEDEAAGLNFQADWIMSDNWDMTVKATYSKNSFAWTPDEKAHQSVKRIDAPMVFQNDVNGGMPEVYFLKDDIDAGGYMFNDALYPDFDINKKETWASAIDGTSNEQSAYLANAQSAETKDNSVETATLGADFTYYVDNSNIFNLVKFGFKYTYNQSVFATQTTNSVKVLPSAQSFKGKFSMDDLGELTQTEEFMGGHNYQGMPLTWQSWDWDAFNNAVWNEGAGTWPGLGITDIPDFIPLDSEHVTEMSSLAAYVMTSFEVGDLSGNFGVRYAYDDFNAYSYNVLPEMVDEMDAIIYLPENRPEGEDSINEAAIAAWTNPDNFYKTTGGREKGYGLPSFNARYTIVEDVFLRFSAALTMNRAPYSATKAKRTVKYGSDENGGDTLTIKGQNPELEPTFSRNYNLGIEWYLPKQGSVTFAIRHKNLRNVRNKETVYLTDYIDPITGLPSAADEIILTRQANDGFGTINTAEFGFRQKLKFMPSFLQHTGINFNTSYSDSDVTKPANDGNGYIELPRPAKVGFNVQYYYQHQGLTARLAYNWRQERLTKTASESRLATMDDERQMLNFSSSYKFNKHFKMSFNIQNVLDENPRRISEAGDLLVGETMSGRHFLLTGHYSL